MWRCHIKVLSSCAQSGGTGPQISVVKSETEHTQAMGGVGLLHLSVIVRLWICFSQMWQLGTPDTPRVCHRQRCYKHKNTQTEVQTRGKEKRKNRRCFRYVSHIAGGAVGFRFYEKNGKKTTWTSVCFYNIKLYPSYLHGDPAECDDEVKRNPEWSISWI